MSSSINPHYTFSYSQPEQYHFSHDSVFLARRIFEELRTTELASAHALDICSGSGIVGLDFLFHRHKAQQSLPQAFDFLEIQEAYRLHFEENKKHLPEDIEFQFVHRNYNDLQAAEFFEKYDLIMSAPPYFLISQGKLSPNKFKNRCRFFIDSDLKNLILGIHVSLRPSGVCYMLLRDLPEHKWNMIEEAQKISLGLMQMTVLGDVLGTHFVRFTKNH